MLSLVLIAGFGVAHVYADCGGCDASKAKVEGKACAKDSASTQASMHSCPVSAAKTVYEKTLAETGCEETAQAAFKKALAEESYSKALKDSGCSKTAAKAAYDAVLAETKCSKSAEEAYNHVVAKAAFDETLKKTGCKETAQKAYDEAKATSSCPFAVAEQQPEATEKTS